jgi:signal peptidase I
VRRILFAALTLLVPARLWLLEAHVVRGTSMWPTYADGEYLLIEKMTVHWLPLRRGDIVVLRHPRQPRALLVKRVVALPGESVMVERDRVTVEGDARARRDEGRGTDSWSGEAGRVPGDTLPPAQRGRRWRGTLTANEIFVLGDRPAASVDSRDFGAVPVDSVVGRVLLRVGRLPPLLRR